MSERIMSFDEWRDEFRELLIQSGMPERQARRYDYEFANEALAYYERAVSPGDAVLAELMLDF